MDFEKTAAVLWVARYDYNAGWELTRHRHDYYQIIYFLEGSGQVFLNSERYPIQEDTLLFIRPQDLHGLSTSQNCCIKTLDLKFMVKDEELRVELSGLPGFMTMDNAMIKELLLNIKEEGLKKKYEYKTISNLYLIQMLLFLLRQGSGPLAPESGDSDLLNAENVSDPVCRKAISYMQAHYSDKITLDTLSNSIGYNKSYICQRFREALKCTPIHFLYGYRIKKSKELIAYSDYSLKKIALLSGFESVHHFTKVFHSFEGLTPGAYFSREKEQIRKDILLDENFININWTNSEHK